MHLAGVITYLKYKPAWLQLVFFGLITMGTTFILYTAGSMVVNYLYGISTAELATFDFSNPQLLKVYRINQAIWSISHFFCSALFFAYKSDQYPFRFLGFRKPQPLLFLAIAVFLLLAAFPLAAWIDIMNHDIHLPGSWKGWEDSIRTYEQNMEKATLGLLQMHSFSEYLLIMLLVAVLPAVCEEVFFRSVMQRIFIQITQRPWVGIIITACLFSLYHGSLLGFFSRALLGALLGMLYWYSGSIWPAIVGHFLFNGIQITTFYLSGKDAAVSGVAPGLVIISAIALAAGTWYCKRISATHYGEWYDTDDDLILPAKKQPGNPNEEDGI